jgi:hypothetical protein
MQTRVRLSPGVFLLSFALLAAMQWRFSAVLAAAAGLYLVAAGAFALNARRAGA